MPIQGKSKEEIKRREKTLVLFQGNKPQVADNRDWKTWVKNQHLTAILRLIMGREQVNGLDDGKSISTSGWQASVRRQSRRCQSAHNSSGVSGCLGRWYDWSSCYHYSDLWELSTEKGREDCYVFCYKRDLLFFFFTCVFHSCFVMQFTKCNILSLKYEVGRY